MEANEEKETKKNEKEERLFAKIADDLIADKREIPSGVLDLVDFEKKTMELEKFIEKKVQSHIGEYDIYNKYLKHIMGIGPMFSANLIAMIDPISDFSKPSSLTAYAGLTGEYYEVECEEGHKGIYTSPPSTCKVMITRDKGKSHGEERVPCGAKIKRITKVAGAPRRKEGYVLMMNTRLKTLMFKINNSFEKQSADKSFYKSLYDQFKTEARANISEDEKGYKLHARLRAIRKVSHRFLVELHVNWTRGLGLPVTDPYVSTLPGHTMVPMELDDHYPLPSPGSIKPISDQLAWSIKQLVGQYYDVQKLRISTYNNITAWIKMNKDQFPDLMKALEKDKNK